MAMMQRSQIECQLLRKTVQCFLAPSEATRSVCSQDCRCGRRRPRQSASPARSACEQCRKGADNGRGHGARSWRIHTLVSLSPSTEASSSTKAIAERERQTESVGRAISVSNVAWTRPAITHGRQRHFTSAPAPVVSATFMMLPPPPSDCAFGLLLISGFKLPRPWPPNPSGYQWRRTRVVDCQARRSPAAEIHFP